MVKLKAPCLVDLCVKTVIENLRYVGDRFESCFDKSWKKFYKKESGVESLNDTVKRMKHAKLSFLWKQLYEAKLKAKAEKADGACEKIAKLYKKEDTRMKTKLQVHICTKVPPSTKKSFWGGGGLGYNVSSKSKIMKKTKVEYLKSNEVKNIAAMKNNSLKGKQALLHSNESEESNMEPNAGKKVDVAVTKLNLVSKINCWIWELFHIS
ncbi:hypothetical protein UlMin_033789 [Ulmus minor]